MHAAGHLGFPAAEDKVCLDTPTKPVRGSIDAKSELEVKERQKLTWAPHNLFLDPPGNFMWLWRQSLWILEIVNNRRIISWSYSSLWKFGHDCTFKPYKNSNKKMHKTRMFYSTYTTDIKITQMMVGKQWAGPMRRGSSRSIVPWPDSYGGARDWRNIGVFVTNKFGSM